MCFRFVEFGQKNCCHLVVSANSVQLNVWSILTLTIVWSVPLRVSYLAADTMSSYMAAFTHDNKCKPVIFNQVVCGVSVHKCVREVQF